MRENANYELFFMYLLFLKHFLVRLLNAKYIRNCNVMKLGLFSIIECLLNYPIMWSNLTILHKMMLGSFF